MMDTGYGQPARQILEITQPMRESLSKNTHWHWGQPQAANTCL